MPLKLTRRSKTGAFYIRGTVAGNDIYESTGCNSKSQAEAYRHRRESQILNRHAHGKAATLTFAEAALTYIQAGGETRFLEKILEFFGEAQLVADLDNSRVQDAAAAIYPNAQPATVNRQLITPISAVVAMAAENGLAENRKYRRYKAKGARTRWLQSGEMRRLLQKADPHLVPILACLIGSGARTSEVLKAEVDDFYPDTGEIWLPETKSGHPRMVQLPRRSLDLIFAHGIPADGKLFRTPKGGAYVVRENSGGNFAASFNKARDAAGLGQDVTPHVLRHTWATWFYASTQDYGRLLDLGGWRTTSTAERYRKIAPADLGRQLESHGWDFKNLGVDLPPTQRPQPRLSIV